MTFIGDKRNAPIWQVVAVVVSLMALATGAFVAGSKNPSQSPSGYYGTTGTDQGGGDYSDYGTSDNSTGGGGVVPETRYIQLNNLIGYGSTSVEQALFRSGLRYYTRYTNGDPSLSARLNDGCVVVDQSPVAGSVIPEGSVVTILADCPLTGNW